MMREVLALICLGLLVVSLAGCSPDTVETRVLPEGPKGPIPPEVDGPPEAGLPKTGQRRR